MTSRNGFSEDDEETWKLLASSAAKQDIGDRLTSLASRFEEDGGSTVFWGSLTDRLGQIGFSYANSSMGKLQNNANSAKKPVAFDTEGGKHHLDATAALLQISEERAVQVTLDALRSIDSEGSHFQSLLGSRDLLWKTLLHHHQQRLARIGTLAECLRLEQDPDAAHDGEIKAFLDSIDSLYQDGNRHRGLFRRLLTIACASTVVTTREQLQPGRKLRSSMLSEHAWNSYCSTVMEELQMQQLRERKEALEALLVLLYERIHQGVGRSDLAALLMAFDAQKFFVDYPQELSSNHPAQIAALICVECTALWKTQGASNEWTSSHPLLSGMVAATTQQEEEAVDELESLRSIFSSFIEKALSREGSTNPEALGVVAFGLLIQLAHQANAASPMSEGLFAVVYSSAQEMVQVGNDQCGAFDYLANLLDSLAQQSPSKRCTTAHDFIYDWQFSNSKRGLLLLSGGAGSQDTTSEVTAYSSIARELVAASIAVYKESVLAIDRSNSFENLGMLCNLGNKIFRNNASLCQQFWVDWDIYSNDSSMPYPMCQLLDGSFQMATTALQAFVEGRISQEVFIQAVAPFFLLVSSLSHNADMVETIIGTFPQSLLRTALLACYLPFSRNEKTSRAFATSRNHLLTAIGKLAEVGNSKACLAKMRESLEASDTAIEGPKVLSRLATGDPNDGEILDPALIIMAHMLDGAPIHWALSLAREIMEFQKIQDAGLARCFASGQQSTVHSASLALAELVEHANGVLFCDDVKSHDATGFLDCLELNILAGARALALSMSFRPGVPALMHDTIQNILQSLSNFLKIIRTVIKLNKSHVVQAAALRVRDSIIETLGTNTALGHAIMYYATAPVSTTLTIKLQKALGDKSIMHQVSAEDKRDPADIQKFGAWQSYLASSQGGKSLNEKSLATSFLSETLEKLTNDDIDLEGILASYSMKGQEWKAPLDVSCAAIRLLSLWACHVDEIVVTNIRDLNSVAFPLTGKAKTIIDRYSPATLVSSLAIIPPLCRQGNAVLGTAWESAGFSYTHLLLPYLSGSAEADPRYPGFNPSPTLLDLLNTCVIHTRSSFPRETISESPFLRALYQSQRFPNAMSILLSRAESVLSVTKTHDREDRAVLLDGLLGLRVLATCVGSNRKIACASLFSGTETIIDKLISVASEVKKFPLAGSGTLFGSENDVSKMRLATGALAVLSSLWQNYRNDRSPSDPFSLKLRSTMDGHTAFIARLTAILSSFAQAKDLEDRVNASSDADYAHGSLVTYNALVLQILSAEAAYQSSLDSASNSVLVDFLLHDFVHSTRFVDFTGFRRLAAIYADFEPDSNVSLHPASILDAFPSTSGTCLIDDFFTAGNSFDLSAASHFLAQLSEDGESLNEILEKFSISRQLATSNLMIMKAWNLFSSRAALFSSQLENGAMSSERQFELVEDTIATFEANLRVLNQAQSQGMDFLLDESQQMINVLCELLLFFLDLCSQGCGKMTSVSLDARILCIEKLAVIGELAFAVSSAKRNAEAIQSVSNPGTIMMAGAVIALGFLDSSNEISSSQFSRIYSVGKKLCLTNSRVLVAIGRPLSTNSTERDYHVSFRCCVVLLSSIISIKPGPAIDDSHYFKSLSQVFVEFNVMDEVLFQGIDCSANASRLLAADGSISSDARVYLETLHAVLDLLFSMAESGNSDLLNALSRHLTSKLLVRNPLFEKCLTRRDQATPRGYLPVASRSPGNADEDLDSVINVWKTSMKILTAAVCSSSPLNENHFVRMIYEFLELNREKLLASLNSLDLHLTCSGLEEATCILSMIAEMCKRENRDEFRQELGIICHEYISKAAFVLAVLSRFLVAAGTARELYICIEQFASNSEHIKTSQPFALQQWHPLMEEGISTLRHEAVKFSSHASKMRHPVTDVDFREASQKSAHLSIALMGNVNESELEKSSKATVTNVFAEHLEREVALCLTEALAVVWRMHPSSFSFRCISEEEKCQLDVMGLAPIGAIIGFRPVEGDEFRSPTSEPLFSTLTFGRVIAVDTVRRVWEVRSLDESGEGNTWHVRAGQLTSFEETTLRKTITKYKPAPDSMSELEKTTSSCSLGSLISILRWCHQECALLASASNQSAKHAATIRLAEQASILLGTELSLHNENEGHLLATSKDKSKLCSQVFELFAESSDTGSSSGQENARALANFENGRLKEVLSPSIWTSIRLQVLDEIRHEREERLKKEDSRSEKRPHGVASSFWSGGTHLSGRVSSERSAFRGFR